METKKIHVIKGFKQSGFKHQEFYMDVIGQMHEHTHFLVTLVRFLLHVNTILIMVQQYK